MLSFTPTAWLALRSYGWPGNVRELANETRRLLVMTDGEVDLGQLSPTIAALNVATRPAHELDLRGTSMHWRAPC